MAKPSVGRIMPRRKRETRPRANLDIPLTSLLWPPGATPGKPQTGTWENDLGIGDLVQALSEDKRYTAFVRQTLLTLNTDTEVIAWRQAALNDLINNPALLESCYTLLPRLADLRQGHSLFGQRQRNLLLETADRLAELDLYVTVVHDLHIALSTAQLKSPGFAELRNNLAQLTSDPNFEALRRELPELRAPLENIASLTIGINLDWELQPISAVLLSINNTQFGEPASFLERLIGARNDEHSESGIAPLHYTPKDPQHRPLSQLFQDLDRLLTQVAQPIARALNRYVKTGTGALTNLEYELAFFIAAARLIERLKQQGMTFCCPAVAPADERLTDIKALTHITLALKQKSVPIASGVELGTEGRIAVLTGPNSGGKTTYLRSVGLAQVLFQAGLLIPAQSARMSPVDAILTHFPALETIQQGRLAEEAIRLREIFQQAGPHSLVLLNETFSSTSSGEALYLAHDILCALRVFNVRAIYATHLTELAERLAEIEAAAGGDSRLFSLIASVRIADDGQVQPTFEIKKGLPLGRSYAQEIARRHGINLEQILRARQPE